MKLRKQTPAKAVILMATAGLLFAFWSLVRADPQVAAQPAPQTNVDYDRFFAPGQENAEPAEPAPAQSPDIRPHTRTRAS